MGGTIDRELTAEKTGLYIDGVQITNFVPRVIWIKKIFEDKACRFKYGIRVDTEAGIANEIEIENLFVRSWFALVPDCSDAALTDRERRLIQEYLQKQVPKLQVLFEISPVGTGWTTIDGCDIFCTQETAIFCGMPENYVLNFNGCQVNADSFEAKLGNCAAILRGIQSVNKGVSWILYISSYLGFMKSLFYEAGYPAEFIVNLFGKSGTGKTSLMKTVAGLEQIFSFRSRKRRDVILRELQQYTGENVLIDDYHPAESKADQERQNSLKDSLVRLVEESNSAPNIFISSEYLAGHFSMQDREIQLFMSNNLNWALLEEIRRQKTMLNNIRLDFMVEIVRNRRTVVSEIQEYCQKADTKILSSGEKEFRSNRYIYFIDCLNLLFEKYFIEKYCVELSSYDIMSDLVGKLNCQTQHMKRVRSIEKDGTYLVAVRDMLLDRSILFNIPNWIEFIPSANVVHINQQGMIHVSYQALCYGMMKYMNTTQIPIKKIIAELRDAEVLVRYEKSKDLTKVHNGKHYYQIDTDILNEYCKMFE